MVSVFGRRRPWVPAASISLFAGSILAFSVLGCGNLYRPVVTSLPPVQPPRQPIKYAIVTSCADATDVSAPKIDQVCNSTRTPGLVSVVNFSGDSLAARINIGTGGPRWTVLSSNGALAYVVDADSTISTFLASSTIQAPLENKNVNTSTLPPTPAGQPTPNTLLYTNLNLYVSQPGRSSIEVLDVSGSLPGAPGAYLEIPVAPNPVNFVGNNSAQRIYVISQGSASGTCPTSGPNGVVTAIETSTNTPSATIPVGRCPIYGVMSPDDRRTFILNQGGNTITVLDSQQNQIDPNFPNGITVGDGPVWADILNNSSLLAVANSRSNTVSLIDISTDAYGHDGPNFGQIVATIPVGNDPYSLSFLQDGSQLFVANRGDGTVSAINLTTYKVNQTISLPVQPCDPTHQNVGCSPVHPISIAATTGVPIGKVYVVSPDTNVLTILRTDDDTIYENLPLTGNGVQVRVSAP
ncbi:MAG: YncE family protein [Acidobacteriaceae bacterium]